MDPTQSPSSAPGPDDTAEVGDAALDAATRRLTQARDSGDHEAILCAATDLADLLDDRGRPDDARQALQEADLANLRMRLAADLVSDDPETRSQGWWHLGAQLHWHHRDPVGAAAAYREAIAAGGPAWVNLAATMNLAQVLEDVQDTAGARLAYEQVYLLAAALPDSDLSDPAIAHVVAQRLAGLQTGPES
ncbi:hypothetical protein [Kineosporia sp. A_224]|uniref:hypothetical protein n=1 Tax=Kineosporia sp. A_224 TaxID=1962180 RepID=UPI000B4B3B48|nr:hypothetical protein [Kineosporia sp. A_224]